MAEQFPSLTEKVKTFIEQQAMFFVGTADADGFVNVSPKGQDTLRILNDKQVLWLNLTGSGNESAAHVQSVPRMTIMFCSFGKQPLILRLYGQAKVFHPRDVKWQELINHFPDMPGTRQLFLLDIELVQTSCGYAVPHYELQGQRITLNKWAENKGTEGVAEYWQEKNTTSLDGKATGI